MQGLTSRLRPLILGVAASVFGLVLLEGLFSWAYAIQKTWQRSQPTLEQNRHVQYDRELGWTHRPGAHIENLYGPGRHLTINAQGFRAHETYTKEVPEGRSRVAFAGDSFTMGLGVDDTQTFPAQVEVLDPSFQSVNLGMKAYGLGQAYLSYLRIGSTLDTDIVVLAFISNDFQRLMQSHFMAPKPQLVLGEEGLVVENVPVPPQTGWLDWPKAAREFSYWLDIAKVLRRAIGVVWPDAGSGTPPEAVDFAPVAEQLFVELDARCQERGQRLLLVYLPTHVELEGPLPVADWVRVRDQIGHL